MWTRQRFDISPADLIAGTWYCLTCRKTHPYEEAIKRLWQAENVVPFLSVRSGFDLLWQVLQLPPESEVLMSALTIRHMADIVRHHKLVPVPIDVDLETMAPRLDLLERAINEKTRAIVVAHLFGGRFPLEPIIELAAAHQLLVIEDCAQAFAGGQYHGHPDCDVSMFSFGPIKTATALAGAVFRFRNAELAQQLATAQKKLPQQNQWKYLFRLLKYGVLKSLSGKRIFGFLVKAGGLVGWDYDRFIFQAVRGFPGQTWMQKIRRRPSAALLALLVRRLSRFNMARFNARVERGEKLLELLSPHVFCPGRSAPVRTHWAFPVMVENRDEVIAALRKAGFDAAASHSLYVSDAPADRPWLEPENSRLLVRTVVCLPIYPEIPMPEIERMAQVVLKAAKSVQPQVIAASKDDPPQPQ